MKIDIGKIINTHGIKGEIKVLPLTDDMTRYSKLNYIYVAKGNKEEKFNIESIRYVEYLVYICLEGLENLDDVLPLKDGIIRIEREDAVKLPSNTFFIFDIIGCSVYSENEECYGEVVDVIATGSNDVYVVKETLGGELLIPALKTVVKKISIEEKRIIVQLPETEE